MISGKRLVKENILAVGSQFMNFARGILFNIIFPVIMGPILFGRFSILVGYYYLLLGLFVGFDYALLKEASIGKDKAKAFYNYLYLKIVVFLISLLVLAVFLKLFYEWIQVIDILFASVFALLLSMQNISMWFNTSGFNNFKNFKGVTMYSFMSIVFPLVFYVLLRTVFSVVIGLALAALLGTLMVFPLNLRRVKFTFKLSTFKMIRRYSIIFLLNNFLTWGVLLVLSFFSLPAEVAQFKVALSWVLVIVSIIPVSVAVVFTSFIKVGKENKALFKRYLNKTLRYSFIILVPLMFGFYLLAPLLIRLLYGEAYAPAAGVLSLLSWSVMPLFLINILVSVYASSEKEDAIESKFVVFTLLAFILSLVLCYLFKLEGAAAAFLISSYAVMSWMVFELKIKKIFLNNLKKPLFSSLLMSLLVYELIKFIHSVLSGIAVILVGVLFYFFVLFLVKGVGIEDFKILKFWE